MQNEATSLYDVPAQALLYTHEGLGAERELGEVEVVSTFFGGAKIRPVRKDGGSGWGWWLLALVAVAGAGVVILLRQPAPEAGSVAAPQITTPQVVVPQASAPQVAAPQTPVQQVQPIAQAPAQKPAAAAVDKTKLMLEKLATDKPRKKLPVAQPKPEEDAEDTPARVPVSINPVAAQPAMQITKTPPAPVKPAPAPAQAVSPPSSESGTKTTPPPASNEPQPNQPSTQP